MIAVKFSGTATFATYAEATASSPSRAARVELRPGCVPGAHCRPVELLSVTWPRSLPIPCAVSVDLQNCVVQIDGVRSLVEIDVRDGVVGESLQGLLELSRSKSGAHPIQYRERRPRENEADDKELLLLSQ